MKKIMYSALAAISVLAIVACEKEAAILEPEAVAEKEVEKEADENNGTPGTSGELISITVSIPEGLTKVDLTQDAAADGPVKLAWHSGDVITVNEASFTLKDGEEGKSSAIFQGAAPAAAASYTITYDGTPGGFSYANQTQSEDADTDHLFYKAVIAGADSYEEIAFTDTWATAHGGTFSQSSVLRLRAQLPAAFIDDVRAVIFKSSANIYNGGKTLKVNLSAGHYGDPDDDGIITFYAVLPPASEDVDILVGTDLLFQFQVGANDYDIYTGYRQVSGSATAFKPGRVNAFKLALLNIASYANASTTNIGESTNPYLIGDQHQMQAISLTTTKQYYKLVDDIDMTGVSWTSLNAAGTNVIDLDGNNKKLQKMTKPLFDDLNGKVINLTIEDATIAGGANITGILANTIKTAAAHITNVDIASTDETFETAGSYSSVSASMYLGGLIGHTNKNNSISGCDIVAKVNQTSTTSDGDQSTGGFMGRDEQSSTHYDDCTVKVKLNSDIPGKAGVGGFIGRIGRVSAEASDLKPTFTNCKVLSGSRIDSDGNWTGGFVGYVCSGGTFQKGDTDEKICSSAADVYVTSTGNFVGGFVGFAGGGTFTDCAALGIVSSATTNVGGFVGCSEGKTSFDVSYTRCYYGGTSVSSTYSSSSVFLGGFCGLVSGSPVTFSNCYVHNEEKSVSITGNGPASGARVGGFVGQNSKNGTTGNATTTDCYVKNAAISGKGQTGGFAGVVYSDLSRCYVEGGSVSSGAAQTGGFAGYLGSVTIEQCFSTCSVNSTSYPNGGFVGNVANNGATIKNCYSTGEVLSIQQRSGGFVGVITNVTAEITNCYATGDVKNGSFGLGGLIARIEGSGVAVSKCVAWNSNIQAMEGYYGSSNWSTGAVVGVTFPTCTLSDNYRKPGMNLRAYWGPGIDSCDATFDHGNVNSSNHLKDKDGNAVNDTALSSAQLHYPIYPYHGRYSSETNLSTLASGTLNWNETETIWDFTWTDNLPHLAWEEKPTS